MAIASTPLTATIVFPLEPHRRVTVTEAQALSFITGAEIADPAQEKFTVTLTTDAAAELTREGYIDRTEGGIRADVDGRLDLSLPCPATP